MSWPSFPSLLIQPKQTETVSVSVDMSVPRFNQPGNPNSAAAFKSAHTWLMLVIRAVTLLWGSEIWTYRT